MKKHNNENVLHLHLLPCSKWLCLEPIQLRTSRCSNAIFNTFEDFSSDAQENKVCCPFCMHTSTKLAGTTPVFPSRTPSYQFSSRMSLSKIMSPFANERSLQVRNDIQIKKHVTEDRLHFRPKGFLFYNVHKAENSSILDFVKECPKKVDIKSYLEK